MKILQNFFLVLALILGTGCSFSSPESAKLDTDSGLSAPPPKFTAKTSFKTPDKNGILQVLATETNKSSPTSLAGGSVSLLDFPGMDINSNDNTAAINKAAAYCKSQNKALYVAEGIYKHAGIITFDSITAWGPGTFLATDTTGTAQSIVLQGTNAELNGLNFGTQWTGKRQSSNSSQKVLVSASGFTIENCKIHGSAAGGIMLYGASNGKVSKNHIENTLADGIHHTHGTNNIITSENHLINTGDDGIAVVGYIPDTQPNNIIISHNNTNTSATRGITSVGGSQIQILDNQIIQTTSGCILAVGESSYNTYASKDVTIANNDLFDCNTSPTIINGGILITGYPGQVTTNIKVINNRINYTGTVACHGPGISLPSQYVDSPEITGNTIINAPSNGIFSNASSPQIQQNTISGSKGSGIQIYTASSGHITINSNRISNSCVADVTNTAHINIENINNDTSIQITDNIMSDGNNAPKTPIRFIPPRNKLEQLDNTWNGSKLEQFTDR